MCGRFVGFRRLEELQEHFSIDVADVEVTPNYNIAPHPGNYRHCTPRRQKSSGEAVLGAGAILGQGHQHRQPDDQCTFGDRPENIRPIE